MYLRFVSKTMDEDSHRPRGLFTEAYALLDSGDLNEVDWSRLRSELDWFKENLPVPPENFKTGRAVFWFRQDARECIQRIWEMVYLLRNHGIHVSYLTCRHLHNRIYSDDLQVAAYPHDEDDRIIEH